MSVVKVNNITKEISKVKILDNISLEIKEGEVFILEEKIPNRKVLQNIGYMAQADALYEDYL